MTSKEATGLIDGLTEYRTRQLCISGTLKCFSDERIEQAIIKAEAKLLILDPLQAYIGSQRRGSIYYYT
jgi:hypothetical protein